MDYLAHALWSYIVFHRTSRPKLAMLFGVLPDTLSWVPYLLFNIIMSVSFGRPNLDLIPQWVMALYGISHSIIIVALVFGITYLILKRIPLFMYAYPLHILIDIPSHTKDFLPTPFLWPISEYAFPGISWGHPVFMVINYVTIICCLVYIFIQKKKNLQIPKRTQIKNKKY